MNKTICNLLAQMHTLDGWDYKRSLLSLQISRMSFQDKLRYQHLGHFVNQIRRGHP